MIISIWKKIGESTHLLAKKVGELTAKKTGNPEDGKATHTGTLDPMAEGVVVVLTGKDRYKKSKFTGWKKIYQFEILFGVDTDSLDLLGLQTDTAENLPDTDEIEKQIATVIPSFVGKQKQTQPKFSAQRIGGKSGFDLAKQKQAFEIKTNNIEILSLKILGSSSQSLEKLKKEIDQKISQIKGDFRQGEILEDWKKTFSKLEELKIKNLPIIKLEAAVSKRTYIRSLVRDISKKINLPATTFSIIRTKNGFYNEDDCKDIKKDALI